MRLKSQLRYFAPVILALLTVGIASGQNNPNVVLQLSPADFAAQESTPAPVYGGMAVRGLTTTAAFGLAGTDDGSVDSPVSLTIPSPGFYGTDVGFHGGARISNAQHHPIYVNQPPSHWGDPATFLTDLGQSDFISLLDQYVGTSGNSYTMGTSYQATATGPLLHRPDIVALLHAAAAQSGGGYGHIYHVFLPQGMDVCFGPAFCYSPDNPATFAFCALHNSVTFIDPAVGHVIFTLEPYQNAPGCSAPPHGTPNGQTADSTYYSLSHEVFETISDPDLNAWVGISGPAQGQEIADLCVFYGFAPDGNIYTDAPIVMLNGNLYAIQAEYSNQVHGCVYPAHSAGHANNGGF